MLTNRLYWAADGDLTIRPPSRARRYQPAHRRPGWWRRTISHLALARR